MSFPSVVVEFSPGTGPFDTPSWVDISDRVLSLEWTVGTQRDLEDFPPGEATIVLRNDDRLFDPEHTTGTYFGDLLPRVPFRIRATAGDSVLDGTEFVLDDGQPVTDGTTTHDCFYGFVEDGWEQTYMPPAVSTCTVRLVDLLAVLEGYTLPSVLEAEVLADSPDAYWPFDEARGRVALDKSGNNRHLNLSLFTEEYLSELLSPSGDRVQGLEFTTGLLYGTTKDTALTAAVIEAMEAVVYFDQASGIAQIASVVPEFSESRRAYLAVTDDRVYGVDSNLERHSAWTVDDGRAHHVAYTEASGSTANLVHYFDGDTTTTFDVFGPVTDAGLSEVGQSNTFMVGKRDSAASDTTHVAGHIAVWLTAPSQARMEAHGAAWAAPLDGLRSDEQVAWILEQIGVPTSMYDLDEGASIMGPLITKGRNALEVLREITRTEQGGLYVDHLDGGKLRFRYRFHSWLETRATVSQATFSDDPAADYNRVDPDSLVIEPNGVRSVINRATVTWAGGEETSEDTTSRTAYGPRGVQVDTLAATAAVARGVGDWIVAHNAQPATRVRGFGVDAGAEQAGFYPVLNLHIGDRVTFRHKPQDTGAAVTRDLEVLGATHRVDNVEWRTDFYVRDAPDVGVELFLLGSSELGGTHVLAY